MAEAMERRQIALYLLAIGCGVVVGTAFPAVSGPFEVSINPVLGLLLFATFLGIPFADMGRAVRDWRFMGVILTLNFLLVPLVVFGLSRFVAGDQALLIGVLLVLLTPCIDYVIVFSKVAGGASDRLLAAAPILMLAQMALLPLYLLIFAGPGVVSAIEPGPFLEALLLLIILPLVLAALTQRWAGKATVGKAVTIFMQGAMVPLMMVTLAVVVGSQIARLGQEVTALLVVIPLYAAFLVIMVPLGLATARAARLNPASSTAVIFSGATRNSLVVLPLALALPEPLSLAALVVMTQTLVELIGMMAYVRIIPRIVPR